MLNKKNLEKYIEIRHELEMWGQTGTGEMLEQLVWELLGFSGNPEDDTAKDQLNEACKAFGLPEYKDIREE